MRRATLWLALLPALACKSGSSVPGARDAGDARLDAALSGGQVDAGRKPDAATSEQPTDAGARDAAAVQDAGGTSALASLVSAELFARLFPHRADSACNAQVYDHAALVAAAARFPAFAGQGSEAVRKRELAAFLANISHETTGGWPTAPDGPSAWGLCFREERGCEQGSCTNYCDATNTKYPCAAGQTYHGRGPLQLSWNYNYGQVGDALQLDLLHDPGRVTRDGVVGFEAALWFWMTPQAPKPSAHDVMIGAWQPSAADSSAGRLPGFGLTVNIINGGLECGIAHDMRVEDRVAFFERYASVLGTDVGENLRCATMKSF